MQDGLSPAPSRPGARRESALPVAGLLAAAYALLGLLAVVTLARLTPPFQNPDELAHVLRAEQLSQGGVIGTRFADPRGVTAGGRLDPGAERVYQVFEPLVFQPAHRATRTMFEAAAGIGWDGPPQLQHFTNTVVYPPVLYLPAAAAIAVGHAAQLSVMRTLHLARLAGGIVAVALGTLAVALAGGAAPLLFALLSLPMTLSLMAAVSQDALLLPVAALAAALLLRLRSTGGGGMLAAASLCLALVGAARPAYLPVAALPLLGPALRPGTRWLAAALVAAAILAWAGLAAATTLVNLSDSGLADPAAQIARLLADPVLVLHVALGTLRTHGQRLLESFLGRLGWLDLVLPAWLRDLALAGLVLGALTSSAPVRRGAGWLGLGVALATIGAVFGLEYVAWTPLGAGVVEGVQGRYFLPVALLLAACLPSRPLLPRAAGLALPAVAALTLAGTVWQVVDRYYLR